MNNLIAIFAALNVCAIILAGTRATVRHSQEKKYWQDHYSKGGQESGAQTNQS